MDTHSISFTWETSTAIGYRRWWQFILRCTILLDHPNPNTCCSVHEMRINLSISILNLQAFEKHTHTSLVLLIFLQLGAKNMIWSFVRAWTIHGFLDGNLSPNNSFSIAILCNLTRIRYVTILNNKEVTNHPFVIDLQIEIGCSTHY